MDTFKLSFQITFTLLYSLFASTCCALAVEAVGPRELQLHSVPAAPLSSITPTIGTPSPSSTPRGFGFGLGVLLPFEPSASPSASPSSTQPSVSTRLIVYSLGGTAVALLALLLLYRCYVLARPFAAQQKLHKRSTAQSSVHQGEVDGHIDPTKPLPAWVAWPTANGDIAVAVISTWPMNHPSLTGADAPFSTLPLREPDNGSGTTLHPTPLFPALAIPGGNPHSGVVSIDDYSHSAALKSAVAVAVSHALAAAEAQSSVTPTGAPHADSTITEAQRPHHLSSDSAVAVMTSAEGASSSTSASQYPGAQHPTPSAPFELGAAYARPDLPATPNAAVPSHFSSDGSEGCSDSETGCSDSGSSLRPDTAADPAAADPTVAMGDIGTGLGSIPSGRARSSGGRREQKRQQDIYGKL